MAFTTKEIRDAFRDATQGVHATKGRGVTFDMMDTERDEISRTIEKVRKILPAKGTYILRKKVSA